MKSEVVAQKRNPFLKREELVLKVFSDAVPTKDEVMAQIDGEDDLTVIKKINTNFGQQVFIVEAVLYDSKEDRERVEVIPKKIRKKMEKERMAAEAEERKKLKEEVVSVANDEGVSKEGGE
jgi:ribosomal protein S24E